MLKLLSRRSVICRGGNVHSDFIRFKICAKLIESLLYGYAVLLFVFRKILLCVSPVFIKGVILAKFGKKEGLHRIIIQSDRTVRKRKVKRQAVLINHILPRLKPYPFAVKQCTVHIEYYRFNHLFTATTALHPSR